MIVLPNCEPGTEIVKSHPGVRGGLKTTVTETLPISQWQYHCQSKRKSIYIGINAEHLLLDI